MNGEDDGFFKEASMQNGYGVESQDESSGKIVDLNTYRLRRNLRNDEKYESFFL